MTLLPDTLRQTRSALFGSLGLYVLSVLSIQGAAYITQFLLVNILNPEDFGVLRSIESLLSLALLIGSMGMPSLAIKEIAQALQPEERSAIFVRLLGHGAFFGVVAATAVILLSRWLLTGHETLLLIVALSIPFTVNTRICANYLQSTGQLKRLALFSVAMATFSVVSVVGPTYLMGLEAWPYARLFGELCIGVGIVTMLLKGIDVCGGRSCQISRRVALVAPGMKIMVSLLIRAAIDTLPIVLLNYYSMPLEQIGYYGLANLIGLAVIILPGSISNLALPRYARAIVEDRVQAGVIRRKNLVSVGMTASLVALLIGLLTFAALPGLLPAYQPALPLIAAALVLVVIRALVSSFGMVLMAHDRNGLSALVSGCQLATAVIANAALIPSLGVIGVFYVAIFLETAVLLFYALVTPRVVQHIGRHTSTV